MHRAKSNWHGTLYEYDRSQRNSCWRCIHCGADGACIKQNTVISLIGASFYKNCRHYTIEGKKPTSKAEERILDKKEFERNHPKKTETNADSEKSPDPNRIHSKTVRIGTKKYPNSQVWIGFYHTVSLRRILDDRPLTVTFTMGHAAKVLSGSSIAVSTTSLLAKILKGKKVGQVIEYDGYRYSVEAFK